MVENHQYLVTLGVSHPALETIKEKTAQPYGLSTKLTGAGGGGCAVTLIPDGTHVFSYHCKHALHEAKAEHYLYRLQR